MRIECQTWTAVLIALLSSASLPLEFAPSYSRPKAVFSTASRRLMDGRSASARGGHRMTGAETRSFQSTEGMHTGDSTLGHSALLRCVVCVCICCLCEELHLHNWHCCRSHSQHPLLRPLTATIGTSDPTHNTHQSLVCHLPLHLQPLCLTCHLRFSRLCLTG